MYLIKSEEVGSFEVKYYWDYEWIAIKDLFDDTVDDIEDIERKVDNGDLWWIVASAKVFLDGAEIGSASIGGILLNSIDDLTDSESYILDDIKIESLYMANEWIARNRSVICTNV
jgi:hypothetical protein